MIIYVDVLLFVNFVIDLLLLKLSVYLSNFNISFKRIIISAVVCSLFSLYIFIPKVNFIIELLLRLSPCFAVGLICKKGNTYKQVIRLIALFYAVSFIFAGAMLGISAFWKQNIISVKNGVVYLSISPLLLIALSFIIYLLIIVLQKLTKRKLEFSKRVEIVLDFKGKSVKSTAMVDSGFSFNDSISNKRTVMIDKNVSCGLFGIDNTNLMLELKAPENEDLATSYRFVTVKTVSGLKPMPAVKLSKLKIITEDLKEYKDVLAIICADDLGDDFEVIIPMDMII